MIIIQPIGGLCNRMRAINSARILAKTRGDKLTVIWNVNPELGCPFEKLFERTDAFKVINIHSKFNVIKLFHQLTGQRIGNDEIRSLRQDGNLPKEYVDTLKKKLFIATEEHFFVNHDYTCFVPTKEIRDKISTLTKEYKAHNVGVHIRRTDNKPAIGKSSTQAFIDSIQKELDADPNTMFYLATDDLNEEANLRKIFGDHILSNESRDLSRDSVQGIMDALVDLTCLSKTDKIIGSFFSSFTDIAADMTKIPKCIAGEDD